MPRCVQLRFHATVALMLFVMALGTMGLAPWVRPVVLERVCSANGSRVVDGSTPGVDRTAHSDHGDPGGHCPLCMPAGVPPSAIVWDFTPVLPLRSLRQRIPEARLASLAGAPLPARGPPRLT